MVDTTTRRLQAEGNLRRSSRRWALVGALVVAVTAVVVSVVLATSNGASDSNPSAEVQAVLDDYTDSIAAGDAEAWRRTVADDFFYRQYVYDQNRQERFETMILEEDTANRKANRIAFFPSVGYGPVGDPLVTGVGPWFVSQHVTWTEVPEAGSAADLVFEGTAVYVVVERNGELRVASEVFTGTVALQERD